MLANLLVCGSGFAAKPPVSTSTDVQSMIFQVKNVPVEPQSAEEALSYANRLTSIADMIRSKYQRILAAGVSQSGISTLVVTKIKAIIATIEVQRKNLVDMVMNQETTNITDTEKLNSIISSLESQRVALSDLIDPQAEESTNTIADGAQINVDDSNKSFQIFESK